MVDHRVTARAMCIADGCDPDFKLLDGRYQWELRLQAARAATASILAQIEPWLRHKDDCKARPAFLAGKPFKGLCDCGLSKLREESDAR